MLVDNGVVDDGGGSWPAATRSGRGIDRELVREESVYEAGPAESIQHRPEPLNSPTGRSGMSS
jgi:hypothetical protein